MKIQVLGTAAATSMPLVFCNCETCNKSRILKGKNLRKRSSILINDILLVDLSPDLCSMAYMYNIDLSKIKYLLQTHSHSDHFDAGHFVTRMSNYGTLNLEQLHIICSKATGLELNQMIQENEKEVDLFDTYWQKDMNYAINLVNHGEIICLEDYSILAMNSHHDTSIESMIYLISYEGINVLYATDTIEFDYDIWNILRNYYLDVVFLDQTYGEGCNKGGHLDASQVINTVDFMKNEKIINHNSIVLATHISHEGNKTHDVMEALASKKGYHIAYDGQIIDL